MPPVIATSNPSPNDPLLLDKRALAALLCCSTRHLDRLVDAGKMPPPLKIGALVRWRRSDIEKWLADQ